MKTPVIILYNRVFEKHRICFPGGKYAECDSLDGAQAFVRSQVDLQEVYVNSKPGRAILKGIGNTQDDGCPF